MTLPGVVLPQWVRCGRPELSLRPRPAARPYFYRLFLEAGKLKNRYVNRPELERVLEACEARRQDRSDLRAAWDTWRELLAAVREMEKP